MAKQKALLYLDKIGFDFYLENSKGAARFQFTPDAIKDLEVVNSEILRNQLKKFIEAGKIPPLDLVIIISSSLIFQKDFQITNPSDEASTLQKYIDTVPFDRVSSKIYKFGTTTRVIVINRDLFTLISNGFERNGINTIAILPVHSLPKELQTANGFNVDLARLTMARIESLKHNGIELPQSILSINQAKKDTRQFTSVKITRQTIILVGIFVGLIIILIVVLIMTMRQQTPTPQQTPIIVPPLPTASETLDVSSPAAQLTIDDLQITIVNRSSTSSQGTVLKDQLESAGFINITLLQETPIATQTSQMILPSALSEETRSLLINEVEKLVNNLSVETSDIESKTVELILGNGK